jgi:hypothetical protein
LNKKASFFGLTEVFPSAADAMIFAGEHLAQALARGGLRS